MAARKCSPASSPRSSSSRATTTSASAARTILGFTRVTGEAVLLLNPDTEIRPGALQTLLGRARAAAGCRHRQSEALEYGPHAAVERPCAAKAYSPGARFRDPAPSAVAVRAVGPADRLCAPRDSGGRSSRGRLHAAVDEDVSRHRRLQPRVLHVRGGHGSLLEDRRAGLRIYHVPTAEIVHHSGASSSSQGSTFSAVMMREALHSYMVLNHGWHYAWAYRLATGSSTLVRLLILAPGLISGDKQRRLARKAAFARWWSVLSWSCGQQKWTKRYS